jgi:ABC-2 type transport system permease protein
MANNTSLIEVKERGWLNGFGPLWRKENQRWWGRRSWLLKILLWVVIVDGLLAILLFIPSTTSGDAALQAEMVPAQESLRLFFLLAAILPTFGVIIFGQDTVIDERKAGTAAWVLSKPVSRAVFLLSKLCADALGVLVTMVLAQGLTAYFLYKVAVGKSLPIPGFLAGLGLVTLFLFFFMAMTLMLGTLFHSRGPVIGIPMLVVSSSFLGTLVPWLGKVMPSGMILQLGSDQTSLAAALAQGETLPTVTPVISTGLLIFIFILVALVRFEREEF